MEFKDAMQELDTYCNILKYKIMIELLDLHESQSLKDLLHLIGVEKKEEKKGLV